MVAGATKPRSQFHCRVCWGCYKMVVGENKPTPICSWTPIFPLWSDVCFCPPGHMYTHMHTQTCMCTHIPLLEIILFLFFQWRSVGGCTALFLLWTERVETMKCSGECHKLCFMCIYDLDFSEFYSCLLKSSSLRPAGALLPKNHHSCSWMWHYIIQIDMWDRTAFFAPVWCWVVL